MNIGIIGSGLYALAIMHALEKNDNKIKMWTHSVEILNEFNETKKIASVLDFEISNKVSLTTNLQEVMENSDIIYVVTTSNFFNKVIKDISKYYNKQIICVATKGLDEVTNDFLSNTIESELHTSDYAIISGASFAIDVINDDLISLTVASKKDVILNIVSKSIKSSTLNVELIDDVIGIQLCNTYKNIVAIAAGMYDALGYSNSTNAYLLSKAISELKIIIESLGGSGNTILSSAGIGDLILTCTSVKSRNYSFGQMIIKENIENIDFSNITVEGYYSLLSLFMLLKEKNINSDFINLIYEIIIGKTSKQHIKKYLILN